MIDRRARKHRLSVNDLVTFAAQTRCFAVATVGTCTPDALCVPCRARGYANEQAVEGDRHVAEKHRGYRWWPDGTYRQQPAERLTTGSEG